MCCSPLTTLLTAHDRAEEKQGAQSAAQASEQLVSDLKRQLVGVKDALACQKDEQEVGAPPCFGTC